MGILPLVVLQLSFLGEIKSVCQEFYVYMIPTMNNRVQDFALIKKLHNVKQGNCAKSCFYDLSCVTFFYNSKSGQCQTHSVLLRKNVADKLVNDFRYYQVYSDGCAPSDGLILYRKENICYSLSNHSKSWSDANQECGKKGQRFLKIQTQRFQDHLSKTLEYYFYHSDYVGCYNDNGQRVLPNTTASTRTNLECRQNCRKANFKFAGTQYSTECFCGNSNYDKLGKSQNCKMVCPGKRNEICGGVWALSTYKVGDLYYFGLTTKSNQNTWSDGQALTAYENWATNQTISSINNCTILDPLQGFQWKRTSCDNKRHFLCEKELKQI